MKKYLFILVVFLGITSTSAQVSKVHLAFGTTGIVYPDTVRVGEYISFSFWIKNTGNIALDTSLSINLSVEDSNSILSTLNLGSYNQSNTLKPGDSTFIVAGGIVNIQSFKLGDNIVVIWPAAIGPYVITADKYTGDLFINSASSVDELTQNKIEIYPNPVTDFTQIKANGIIKEYKVLNILGSIVQQKEHIYSSTTAIRKNELESGIYFIELTIDGNQYIKKIIIN